jgi:ABC-type Fe3+/spermidine/putrescine transport system ATPase subunit
MSAEGRKRRSSGHGEGRIHDFHVDEEWHGNFIVLGTTGSGKTTLIRCRE